MTIQLDGTPIISESDVEIGRISFKDSLRSGEKLTGTPTFAEQTTSDLTIDSVALNASAAITVKDREVPINEAVLFRIQGQQAGVTYTVKVTATTDSTPARTLNRLFSFETN